MTRNKHADTDVIIDKDPHKGLRVITNRHYTTGDVVVIGRPVRVVPHRTTHSFQVGWDTHVDLDEPARRINHSCDPNTGIRDNHHGGFDFIALRDIDTGEEITWDYETSEYVSIAVRHCLCAAGNCRTVIKGFHHRREDPRWRPTHLANYLRGVTTVNAPTISPRTARATVASGPVTGRCHGAADRQ